MRNVRCSVGDRKVQRRFGDSVLYVVLFVALFVVLLLHFCVVNEFLKFASTDDLQIVLNAGHDAQLGVERFLRLDRRQQRDAHLVNHLSWLVARRVYKCDWLVFNVDRLAVVQLRESLCINSLSWNHLTFGSRAHSPHLDGYLLDVAVDSDLAQETRKTSFFGGEVDSDDWLVGGVDWEALGGAVWAEVGCSSLAGWVDVDLFVWELVWLAHDVNATDLWVFLVLWCILVVG